MDSEILAYYQRGREGDRLTTGQGYLELLRTREILHRMLPASPGAVLDVGGGTGVYAGWLAGLGYAVQVVDPVPWHAAQAARQPGVSAVVGDARTLPARDASADAVLLLGPLYHLPAPADRMAALAEALRVLRPGGVLVAAAISRFASLHTLLESGRDDPEFVRIVRADLATGAHRNPGRHPGYFTTAYFHRPQELAQEVRAAGFTGVRVLAVEGVAGWCTLGVEPALRDPARRTELLELLASVQEEPSLLGASAHLLAVANRSR